MAHLEKCRVCSCGVASDDEAYNLLLQPLLAVKFSECTNLVVDPDDRDVLPSEICSECYELLEKFHSFRALCIIADNKWRMTGLFANKNIDSRSPVYEVEDDEEENEIQALFQAPELIICDTNLKPENNVNEQLKGRSIIKLVENKSESENEALEEPPLTTFKCDLCDDEYRDERRLMLHKKEHEGHMLYHCTEPGCQSAFSRFDNLRQHELEHSEVGTRYACEEDGCNKMYRHKASLKHHQSKAHDIGTPLKMHMCEFCGRQFKNGSALSQHRFTHNDQMILPFACEMPDCSLRFYSKEKLKIHMMRHQGIKNFSCPYCGLKKTTKNELRLHINYHTLERTWSCKDCPKVCNSSTSLKKHVRAIHEKARDYACHYCEKSFATSDTRKYHEMTHTGEKNFECHACGKRFIQPSALRTHRKVHEIQEDQQTAFTILQVTNLV
ncbi:gastrula zinc finger protein XlCGF46.1 [Drosophila eugracilis]|uniref:gastrula zinc finger protein XlCGF46.1 n=1 Tax=Drosophila eugracilis TaxID=29029 RepID=UPI0007E85A99|nr:gastrula zinc finger protein XlCGF46.1 [Drosophila eugracilis]XP_017080418.1 gastrula zinc finger protein XlCGF46.1 [Drosophila eugracilis]